MGQGEGPLVEALEEITLEPQAACGAYTALVMEGRLALAAVVLVVLVQTVIMDVAMVEEAEEPPIVEPLVEQVVEAVFQAVEAEVVVLLRELAEQARKAQTAQLEYIHGR